MIEVHAMAIPEACLKGSLEDPLRLVPEDTRARVRRFLRPEAAARTLFGAILSRAILCRKLNISAEALEYEAGSNGKPHLAGRSGIEFNLSHSGRWVVMAVAPAPVGVDVEKVREFDPALPGRYFAPEETAELNALPESRRRLLFFSLWTLKESFLKARGTGLAQPLNSFRIEFGPGGAIRTFQAGVPLPWIHFRQYALEDSYVLSVCAQAPDFDETPRLHTLPELSGAFTARY